MGKKVIIIGSGFAGLSSAAFMARSGWDTLVLEKHEGPGGRARKLEAKGFTFDMGPSWYWMPDVFERFFAQFGKKVSDYYELVRLDPSYRVYWENGPMDIPADYATFRALFESIEPGAGAKLDRFLDGAEYKYRVGISKLVFKPGQSISEFVDMDLFKGLFKLEVFNSIQAHIKKYFKHPKLRQLMEFPVLFLGALPENTPALYSLMNYADIKLGTWFPMGGMYSIVEAMVSLAREQGARFAFGQDVREIRVTGGQARQVITATGEVYEADVVIGGADYHFIESRLLGPEYRSYSESWWDKKVLAPSCLLYYVGLDRKLKNIPHHSLFFDSPFEAHAKEIYVSCSWPKDPLFYLSVPTVTDTSLAPPGGETMIFLIPVAAGLSGDTTDVREHYFQVMAERLKMLTGEDILPNIVHYETFAYSDFKEAYNSFKGNAYGLANTLMQTAILKPGCRSKKVSNLFYTGQLTVPGPGVPPSLISGEVVAGQVLKHFGN